MLVEGFVRQLVLGYLGRYVKNFQTEQLKIALWKEEVALENFELILEAFDYLQLPFALKRGTVGKLRIKIPWKKLGREPIVITLEDVLLCACPRDDEEWSMEAVERREFAGKKAKLAGAELGKLSRRVCEHRMGRSLRYGLSYLATKILEGIQISIKNVHVQYCNMQGELEKVVFGLGFSSLTVMKQSPIGSSGGKVTCIEIHGLEIYCCAFEGNLFSTSIIDATKFEFWASLDHESKKCNYILAPLDVALTLMVNKSGRLENDAPQYSMSAELNGLVLKLNEIQLQKILSLWDYLSICHLREKYGRYRPWSYPISRKPSGWQTAWWHYAQDSVLSDVRKRLKKTSWRYLGQRLIYRRKYVNLYKSKLDFLRRDQPVEEFILGELEQMERESDIDDILSYRASAEQELQEFLSSASTSNLESTLERSQSDDKLSGRPRGWLNWLSRGMLGAGGTDDSSQFSGVVSDEIIEDIYEATMSNPVPLVDEEASSNDKVYLWAIHFSIQQISASLQSMKLKQEVASLHFDGVTVGCHWEESARITVLVNSVEMIHTCDKRIMLFVGQAAFDEDTVKNVQPSVSLEFTPVNRDDELHIKVVLQPINATCDPGIVLSFAEFYKVLSSFKFHHERVLLSLNGFDDVKARLLAKAEYILSNRKRITWDVNLMDIVVSIVSNKGDLECSMVLELRGLHFLAKCDMNRLASDIGDQYHFLKASFSPISTSDTLMCFQLKDLYDYFEINLNDFKMALMSVNSQEAFPVLEKVSACISLASCILPDESILRKLEVHCVVSPLRAYFSTSVYGLALELVRHLYEPFMISETALSANIKSSDIYAAGTETPYGICFSITSCLEFVTLCIDLENDGKKSTTLELAAHELDIRYSVANHEDCWVSMKALKISTSHLGDEGNVHDLFSSTNLSSTTVIRQHALGDGLSYESEGSANKKMPADSCFLLHYEACRNVETMCPKFTVHLHDFDLHCYPHIFGLLVGFCDRLSRYGVHCTPEDSTPTLNAKNVQVPGFGFKRFGFSNFLESCSSECSEISLDHFPFVTIFNSGTLSSLEGSLIYGTTGWRKNFTLRDRKIRSPELSGKRGFKFVNSLSVKSLPGSDTCGPVEDSHSFIDLNLGGVKIYFHDQSCIIARITMPCAKSSIAFHSDCFDILCSTGDLILSSSWWKQKFQDFLWGPSSPNFSSILNVRISRRVCGSGSVMEISFGIQHVCCILPTEFLAILIGYFSLPDWTTTAEKLPGVENHMDIENDDIIFYKFEILDSTLISPVESNDDQFLNLEIPQLYCSFIHTVSQMDLLKDIPPECVIPGLKGASRNDSINVFGQDLSLSLLLFSNVGNVPLVGDCDSGHAIINLISPISVDVWVRLPCESQSYFVNSPSATYLMIRVCSCQIIVEDNFFFEGLKALLNVIDQYSLVDDLSKCFATDVLQFLQSKKVLKETSKMPLDVSSMILTEARVCVDSLSIKLYHLMSSLQLIAVAETQFTCSMSLKNEVPILLNISFSFLELHSMANAVILAQCPPTGSHSSALDIHLSRSDDSCNELLVSLPALDIWLHLPAWTEIIELLSSFTVKLAETATTKDSLDFECATLAPIDKAENVAAAGNLLDCFELEYLKQGTDVLIVKSENICISVHIPLWISEEVSRKSMGPDSLTERPRTVTYNRTGGKHCKIDFIARGSELVVKGRNAALKSCMEKLSGQVLICEDLDVHSWPFFQLFQVNIDIATNDMHMKVHIQCDHADVWLSHQVLYFWHGIEFKIPGENASPNKFSKMECKVQARKISFLLTDGRWSCNGPLLEFLLRNLMLHAAIAETNLEGSIKGDLEVNYNNIHKALWEPFVEPWKFQVKLLRKHDASSLLNTSMMTDIHLKSSEQLNLNLSESLIEAVFRAVEMISAAWGFMGPESLPHGFACMNHQNNKIVVGRYAPYVLQNLTSLPLAFRVYQGMVNDNEVDISKRNDENILQPGSSMPIYINETPEEQFSRYRPANSSDRLNEKQSSGVAQHYITIQFDGTSTPSTPISMDLVGLTYFEVDFSKATNKVDTNVDEDASKCYKITEGENGIGAAAAFVVPVVFDVSVQRYSKLVRLYSTVILLNATSMPLELRFDIPFGVSPKVFTPYTSKENLEIAASPLDTVLMFSFFLFFQILDPVYPGQGFPLPIHLAEAGRMRWRPVGNTYLWSEAHNLSHLLSQEGRIGLLRSFVCYPSKPSTDPFRCCLSLQDICLPSSTKPMKYSSVHMEGATLQSLEMNGAMHDHVDRSKKRLIHQITLSTPLVIKNYLPVTVSLTIESGGINRTLLLSEVETSIFHVDSSQELGLDFLMNGFRPTNLKFPRAETFSAMAKFSGTKFSTSEILTFDSISSDGSTYVTVEKVMDAFSGSREICIFVPFLLYNCAGFPITILDSAGEMRQKGCTIPSCYNLFEDVQVSCSKDGLGLVSSMQLSCTTASHRDFPKNSSTKDHIVSIRNSTPVGRFSNQPLTSSGFSNILHEESEKTDFGIQEASLGKLAFRQSTTVQSSLEPSANVDDKQRNVRPYMYSPNPNLSASEIMVRVRQWLPYCAEGNILNSSWSAPFFLVSPSGSTCVLVPQSSTNAAFIISVTSNPVAGPFSGRTRAITFQPRYVISNACTKDLCFKQKGTDFVSYLGIGQHSHLHWTDTTRELLVSIRFNVPGWQWSGSFLPDHLGDTQVKMRNYVSGALNMVRVEVQNADMSPKDEKLVGSPHGNSGTHLILLSDDNTGFMPYRIDNFSKERLRVYQQKCENLETTIHPYTSCLYAWDEPCFPHRLTVEVPGERVVGSYNLDEVKEFPPVYLSSTSEKHERTLLFSVHAEGATKVLSVVDSSYHNLKDMENPGLHWLKQKSGHEEKQYKICHYTERVSVFIPFIGISLINSYPQELLFACARNTALDLLQDVDQQKLSFQISSLQIDNQLRGALYPVILSFDHEPRSKSIVTRKRDDSADIESGNEIQEIPHSSCEPVLCLAVAKWRNRDTSLVSFEYLSFRIADLHLEIEQEVILCLFDFFRAISSRFQSGVVPCSELTPSTLKCDICPWSQTYEYPKAKEDRNSSPDLLKNFENREGSTLLPKIIPIGAPWQKIYLLARKQRKIYVQMLDLAPFKLTLSFSSNPWMLRNGVLTSGESLIHKGLMAVADVEGAQIYFKQLIIAHHMASLELMLEILSRHYGRQLLHELYKILGSAGVIGNPMGFVRNVGLGIKDFLSVPARTVFQSPTGIVTGMAQGTKSLLSNTVYAISDAATQFSKAAQKGIVAFTFDDQAVAELEKQQKGVASSKGVINEVLEGLTGLLQSPIRGAERHGLPGVVSGIALGITGLVARPAASILEVTGKTAQSIRNRSRLYQMGSQRFRVRLPRPLSRELRLKPYSWEEAVGTSVLFEADDCLKLKDETMVICKALKEPSKFVIITERLILVVRCPSLVELGKPQFKGIAADVEWIIETEIGLESVIHADVDECVVHIVGSSSETILRQNHLQLKKGGGARTKAWSNHPTLPLFQTNLELASAEEADYLLRVLMSTLEHGRERGWGSAYLLHQSNLK
ncbi:Vacuolar protein sorting-associated protein 13, DH-like domain [Dillenia turbinata]|uniref:Vacuolar protein sorting-associated protein 13, DH-like domain n=1 Tax=Dillenia turbinata TaxID=194707 RepID=A0AAN8UUW3_9MAGN